jgi:hypothetical protein
VAETIVTESRFIGSWPSIFRPKGSRLTHANDIWHCCVNFESSGARRRTSMNRKPDSIMMSRRHVMSLFGAAAGAGVAIAATLQSASAQTSGMERRDDRRDERENRRDQRRGTTDKPAQPQPAQTQPAQTQSPPKQ